jgi:GPI-anchor transamidase subunit S
LHSSSFTVALGHSALALENAEKAFFDEKMGSMLYCPDEHKYAIYSPLFGPLALPLVFALLKELHGIVREWKSRMKEGVQKVKGVENFRRGMAVNS